MSTATIPNPAVSARIAHDALLGKLRRSMADNQGMLAVITIEAGNFPRLFARFGNQRGNELLRGVADRLQSSMRPQDTVMQVGGFTFVMVIGSLRNTGHAVLAGKKLLRQCDPEVPGPSSKNVRLNAHAGIALFPVHGEDAATLVQRSHMALEVAKESEKDLIVFDDQQTQGLTSNWDMRDELADAVREGELDVHYQPQVELHSGRPCAAEALLRWFSPLRGQVPPDVFFAVAKDNELLAPMTRYVLNAALRNAAVWHNDGHDIGIAVNLPASLLHDPDLVDMLQSLLPIWNTPASVLTLEVTEGAIMSDIDASFATMTRIKELGARISIDDFGTGYSSFSYFKTIPADELKIDRSFVAAMTDNVADQHIVETITNLAHRFKLKVVAEGIEDEQTLSAVRALGCDIGQGYFIARPMPQEQLEPWLDARRY